MMRGAVILVAGLLASCAPAGDGAPAPSSSETAASSAAQATPSPALPAPASLVGEYRVAGIDGAPLDAPFGIALSITAGRVSFEPACAAFVWSYAYRDGALDIERRQEKLGHPPPPVCDPEVPAELRRLASALDAVTRAGRTPANGIVLSGRGRSVLLFSQ